MSKLTVVLSVIIGAVVLAACGGGGGSNPLANTKWQVTDYADPKNTTGMTSVLPGTTLTTEFGVPNKLSGTANGEEMVNASPCTW